MDCHYFNLTVTNFNIYYTFVLILKMVVIETFSEINYQEPEILEKKTNWFLRNVDCIKKVGQKTV